nr:reverse transcriptase domain-containing protein [Tanacetum cinerariifolium]
GNNFNQNRGGNSNQSNFNPSSFNQGQLHRPQVNQAPVYQAPIPQTQRVSQTDFESYVKANDAILRNMQTQGQSTQNHCQNIQNQYQNLQIQMATLMDMMSKFMSANTASSSGSGTLLGNTITNPKEELKGITTRSGVAYQGPKILAPSKQRTEVTKDQVQTPSSQNTAPVRPPVIQPESQASVSEPVVASVSAPMPNLKPFIPYPSWHDNKKRHDQANEQIKKFYKLFKEMSFEISFTDSLILMPKFASTLKALIRNKEKHSEMARTTMNEHCLAVILNKLPRKLGDPYKLLIPCEFPKMDECLALADLGASINLMPLLVWEGLSLPELTPTCMTLELMDRSVSKPIGIAKDVSFKVGVFHFPTDFVLVDFEPDSGKDNVHCPYGTFAYGRMPFGLCNAPGTFQRCMLAIFHDMVEKTMEVFMYDFSVFGNSFKNCLSRLDKMLQRCKDTNPSLNWEKSYFMVKEGIVPGHKISKNEFEVDKAKIDIIAKLPHPTTVKGVWGFLSHAGFYRRFIQDFSKISRPMTHLLEKNTPFIFSKDCIQAFQTLKKKLTEAPILIAPNWDLPCELMCDASDFAIGAVLGQRHEKHLWPIHYASKTMNDAETNYTTTEKEMLAVVYA